MSAANFDACLAFTLQWEGGLSDDPLDPGGETNKGITLRTFSAYYPGENASGRLKAITDEQVQNIYRTGYWNVIGGDALPAGVDCVVWDFSVNAGPKRSVIALQTVAGTERDGIDGPATEAAIAKMQSQMVIIKLTTLHLAFYRADPLFGRYGKGWTNRLNACQDLATKMAAAAAEPPPPKETT